MVASTGKPVASVTSAALSKPSALRMRSRATRQPSSAPPAPPIRDASFTFGPDGAPGGTAALITRTSIVSVPFGCAAVCWPRSSRVWYRARRLVASCCNWSSSAREFSACTPALRACSNWRCTSASCSRATRNCAPSEETMRDASCANCERAVETSAATLRTPG